MNWKGFARKWSHQGVILEFEWRNWETPIRITSNPAKIQTKHLPNVTAVINTLGEWIRMAQGRVQWWIPGDKIMNRMVP
jgi:hypothetical protein